MRLTGRRARLMHERLEDEGFHLVDVEVLGEPGFGNPDGVRVRDEQTMRLTLSDSRRVDRRTAELMQSEGLLEDGGSHRRPR